MKTSKYAMQDWRISGVPRGLYRLNADRLGKK
jgi:hypothetical protein